MIDTTGETDAVKDMVEWFLDRYVKPRHAPNVPVTVFSAGDVLHREFSDKNVADVDRAAGLLTDQCATWWRKPFRFPASQTEDHIHPNIKALIARGNVTLAELSELRCNSWEWEALVPAMNDEAFVDRMKHTLANCVQRRDRPCATYDQALQEVYAPELIKRYESRLQNERETALKDAARECARLAFGRLSRAMDGDGQEAFEDEIAGRAYEMAHHQILKMIEGVKA